MVTVRMQGIARKEGADPQGSAGFLAPVLEYPCAGVSCCGAQGLGEWRPPGEVRKSNRRKKVSCWLIIVRGNIVVQQRCLSTTLTLKDLSVNNYPSFTWLVLGKKNQEWALCLVVSLPVGLFFFFPDEPMTLLWALLHQDQGTGYRLRARPTSQVCD